MNDVDQLDSSSKSSTALYHRSEEEDSIETSTPSLPPSQSSVRPNTHRVPPSTWRNRNLSERRLTTSLDQLSAQDLAVHLYNAFALSRGARSSNRQIETNDDVSEQIWSPPKLWTAWPLAPAVVPAEDEGLCWESEVYSDSRSRSNKPGPREVLKEILLGHLQKKAKERFLEWRRRDDSSGPSEVDLRENEEGLDLLKPVVMADDDLAASIAGPTIRHVLSMLDGLLTGLHHARYAYVGSDGSADASDDNFEDREVGQKRKLSHRSEQNVFTRRKPESKVLTNPSTPQDETDFDAAGQSKTSTGSESERPDSKSKVTKRLKRRKRRYGLRNWSDILGVAAMAGWEPTVVQRAAARCASLFEEGINFRTLKENDNDWTEFSVLPNTSFEETEHNDRAANSEASRVRAPRHLDGDGKASWFYCPVNDCNRSRRGFFEACRLTRHLKQVHKERSDVQNTPAHERGDEMTGGVHVDGFLQPMPMPRAGAIKSRSNRGERRKGSRVN